jgi:NAD(P)-dependent dehydrogenase (short-subunit alcohol dehydrogenase family)
MHAALHNHTVVVIGGSSGIGLETARQARAAGANLVLTARHAGPLAQAARDLGDIRTAAFDAHDPDSLQAFFKDLPSQIDHVMVTAGVPHYGRVLQMPAEEVRLGLTSPALLAIEVARCAGPRMKPGGSLIFMRGTEGRHASVGSGIVSAAAMSLSALIADLALELAPIRINSIAAGFVDTRLSASILGGALEQRRAELRATLPIRRVVGPADVAALAVHIMSNTALTGSTYDVDGGQQLL